VGILAYTIPASILFRRAHKQLYPRAEDDRFTHFLLVLLSPVSAMRACDVLSRGLLENFHPLAVAKVFCGKEQFRTFARATLKEIRYPGRPLWPFTDPGAAETEQEWRLRVEGEVQKLLKQADIVPDELIQAPAAADENCRAYCPRCHAQFRTGTGVCDDCGGLPLIPLIAVQTSKATKSSEVGSVKNPQDRLEIRDKTKVQKP
jgi:hypothetical protein